MFTAKELFERRRQRTRAKIRKSNSDQPRLSVHRSSKHIYAQVIDDVAGHTLVSASTVDKQLASDLDGKTKKEQSAVVGKAVAERALAAGIKRVVFDRGGYLYHGRVKALADGAREGGLEF